MLIILFSFITIDLRINCEDLRVEEKHMLFPDDNNTVMRLFAPQDSIYLQQKKKKS